MVIETTIRVRSMKPILYLRANDSKAGLFLLAFLLFLGLPALSQEVTGTITGRVTDPSGAAINGASVVARDLNRGTTYQATTNDGGLFNIQRLPVGSYEIKVEA